MRSWARPTAHVALLTAGFVAFGSGVGFADTTSGDGSLGSGNQIKAPISVPIDISGNSAAGAGQSAASSGGGATVHNQGSGEDTTSGDGGLLSGNQLDAPVSAPISGCGNSLALAGQSAAECEGGSHVTNSDGGGGGASTSGDMGVLSGNQITAPISAPTDICGNSIAVFGEAAAGCEGGASVSNEGSGAVGTTSGVGGAAAGNQVYAPVSAPVNICGNAVAVAGQSFATCEGGAEVVNHNAPGGSQTTSGDGGLIAGNQAYAPVSAPITGAGNAVSGLGQAAALAGGGSSVHNAEGAASRHLATRHLAAGDTSGVGGFIAGNQAYAPVGIPVDICGNAAAVLGQAMAMCDGGASVHNGGDAGYAGRAQMASGDVESGKPSGNTGGPVTPGLPESPLPGVADADLPLASPADGSPLGGLPTDGLPTDGLPVSGLPVGLPVGQVPLAKERTASHGLPTSGLPTSGLPTSGLPTDGLPVGQVPLAKERTASHGLPTDGLPTDGLPTDSLPTNGLPTDGLTGGRLPLAKQRTASHGLPGTGAVKGLDGLKRAPAWAPQVTSTSRQYTPGGPNLPMPGVRSPKYAPQVTEAGEHVMVPGAPTVPMKHVTLPGWAPQVSSHPMRLNPGSPRLRTADVSVPAWSPGVQATSLRYAPGAPTIPLYKPVLPNWAAGPIAKSGATALPQRTGDALKNGDVSSLPGTGAVEQAPVAGEVPSAGGALPGAPGDATGALKSLPVVGGLAGGGLPAAGGLPGTENLPATEGLPLAGGLPVTDAVSEGTDAGQGGALGGTAGDTVGQLPVLGGLAPVSAVASLANGVGTYFSLALAAAFVAGSGLLMATRRVRFRGR